MTYIYIKISMQANNDLSEIVIIGQFTLILKLTTQDWFC